MAYLTLYFDFVAGSDQDPGQLAESVKSGLERLGEVHAAETSAKPARLTGLEILAAITLAAQVVHHAKDISDDVAAIAANVKKVFETIKGIAKDVKAKDVAIPVNGERKSIFGLTDQDYRTIAEDLRADPDQA